MSVSVHQASKTSTTRPTRFATDFQNFSIVISLGKTKPGTFHPVFGGPIGNADAGTA